MCCRCFPTKKKKEKKKDWNDTCEPLNLSVTALMELLYVRLHFVPSHWKDLNAAGMLG